MEFRLNYPWFITRDLKGQQVGYSKHLGHPREKVIRGKEIGWRAG